MQKKNSMIKFKVLFNVWVNMTDIIQTYMKDIFNDMGPMIWDLGQKKLELSEDLTIAPL